MEDNGELGIRLAINQNEKPAVVQQLVEVMSNLGSGMYAESILFMLINHPDTAEVVGRKIIEGQLDVRQPGTSEAPVIQPHQSRL